MTPERWQQVKSTLAGALEQEDTRQRVAFLDQACRHDSALRSEVQSLLDQPPDEFESIADRIGVANSEPFGPGTTGRRIGAYQLVRELGRGGMGTVWLGKRADAQFEKLVAIKLLKRGTDTEEVLSRFHAERRILARLDHPNIARLLDAGTTEDHLPYFVMEHVEGARLTDYAWANDLSLGERLRLFLKICHAVQFAHQNLVVHRDLKPGNILVTTEAEPKLLDFGVAKLLEPGGDAWQVTLAGHERFTPGYASPEQVRGKPITTSSDVYSLGALLYELLTGVPPHRFPTTSPTAAQIERAVCNEDPLRPSWIAKPPEVRRHLPGDLDTIVLRALAKDPQRRYRSAGHLADDILRYLENRPVRARPDTLAYRAGKFLRRNKLGVAAAALLLLSLVAGVIATARQAQIAQRERARAEQRFDEIRKIANSFLFEFHDSIRDVPGALAGRQLVTRRGVEYLDSLARETGRDRALQHELAIAYDKIADITFDVPGAIESHRKAVALHEALTRAEPQNESYQRALSNNYGHLADSLKIAGRSAEAIEYARKSLAVMQAINSQRPGDLDLQAELAARHDALAVTLLDAGDNKAALDAAMGALTLQQTVASARPGDRDALRALVVCVGRVSDAAEALGDLEVAREHARKHLAMVSELYTSEPSHARSQRSMWAAHFRSGRQARLTGEFDKSREHHQQAIALMEGLASADPNDKGHQRWLAMTYSGYADLLIELRDTSGAIELYRRAASISETLSSADAERAESRRDLVMIYHALGAALTEQGASDEALQALRRGEAVGQPLLETDPLNANIRSGVAEVYAALARWHRQRAENVPAQKETELSTAIAFLKRSLVLWDDVESAGKLSSSDRDKPAAVRDALAQCEALLATPPRD